MKEQFESILFPEVDVQYFAIRQWKPVRAADSLLLVKEGSHESRHATSTGCFHQLLSHLYSSSIF